MGLCQIDKATIFFSHSSLDKENIIPIKNRLAEITAGVLNIFMSSDGQSIPFGNNWVHKIEKGLNEAKIMFVFVTPNSIDSAWIYFETGFAYSKGIKVVPIGIGVKIANLKPPLNLLQGFDIESVDSMNNLIDIINKEFELNFKSDFNEKDYDMILNSTLAGSSFIDINEIFKFAEFGSSLFFIFIFKFFKRLSLSAVAILFLFLS